MDYAIMILQIDLHAWKASQFAADKQILKDGIDEITAKGYNEASERVKELSTAIEFLKNKMYS